MTFLEHFECCGSPPLKAVSVAHGVGFQSLGACHGGVLQVFS